MVALQEERSSGDARALALEVHALSKTFPGVRALRGIDLAVRTGSVHAVLGHNGCGKSTFVKALAGVYPPDPGAQAWVDGEELEIGVQVEAERKGLRFVHQDLGLVEQLGAADNIGLVIGYERTRSGRIDWAAQARGTDRLLSQFGIDIDPTRPLSEASPPQRTAVAIVRAIAGWQHGKGVLVLDEPTASLPAREVDQLFHLIRSVRDTGTAVILVSHRLDEVMAIADEATVLRAGSVVWKGAISATSTHELVKLIADTDDDERPAYSLSQMADDAPIALTARRIVGRYLRGIDVTVRRGEVVGVAGLLGSGREELPYIVAGATTEGVSGEFVLRGEVFDRMTIQLARESGIAFVPADRAHEGIISEFTTSENVSVASLSEIAVHGVVQPTRERDFSRSWLSAVKADPETSERPISTLSGGNQQKAVLARWLAVAPEVLVMSEPTAGVDMGARHVLYDEMRARASQGLAILVSSSDVEDLLAVCDRVIVLRDGQISASLHGDTLSKSGIIAAMEGVYSESPA